MGFVAGGALGWFGPGRAQVNLGGEGELPGYINQQPPLARDPGWTGRGGQTLQQLAANNQFVVSKNAALPFRSNCAAIVQTRNTPVDILKQTGLKIEGPIVANEALRVVAPGGRFVIVQGEQQIVIYKPIEGTPLNFGK